MLQPPKRVRTSEIPPREYIFIVDVSGSMHGFPLNISKKLLKNLIGNLRPSDKFNVLLFAGGSSVMSDHSLHATRKNINRAVNLIERQRGGGGTRLLPALKQALALPGTEDFSRSIIIATDGYVAVEEKAFDLIRNRLGDANMFTFGIGSSVNRHLIEGMARVGMGEPFVITKPDEADEKAQIFRKLIQTPVLTNIEIDYGRFNVYDVEPISIPDVLAERPIIVFGKYRGKPKGKIKVSGITGDGNFRKKVNVNNVVPSTDNSALRYLWARHRIAILSDYNKLDPKDERIREVTTLGLNYNLLTSYTSFVAIDSQKRLQQGKSVTVKQPLPLPEGVSDAAVGGRRYAAKSRAPLTRPRLSFSRNGIAEEEAFEVKKDLSASPVDLDKSGISVDKITIGKGLPKKSAENLIKKQLKSINKCYQKGPKKYAHWTGEMFITLVIDSKGHVKSIYSNKNKKRNKILESCIIPYLKQLVFQKPYNGRNVEIKIKFSIK
jgi:Ca-activated chloride channel family protein